MPLQSFMWGDFSHHDCAQQRSYYRSFTLQDESYAPGACCLFFPDVAGQPMYIGRILSAFADCSPDAIDVHCLEVRWFEHVSKLEPNSACDQRELVELLEVCDVNPLGSLASKTVVIKAQSLEEAERLSRSHGLASGSWFYSRGVFKQSSNEFIVHASGADAMQVQRPTTPPMHQTLQCPVSSAAGAGPCKGRGSSSCSSDAQHTGQKSKKQRLSRETTPECCADQHAVELHPSPALQQHQAASERPEGKLCVECGATQTPQWREGPAGPKTLCNACGVRYNRLRANRKGSCFAARSASARQKAAKPAAAAQSHPSPPVKQQQQQQQRGQEGVPAARRPKPTAAAEPQAAAAPAPAAKAQRCTPSLQSADSEAEQLLLSCLLDAPPCEGPGAGYGFDDVLHGGAQERGVEMARAASAASCVASAPYGGEGSALLGTLRDMTRQDSVHDSGCGLASFPSFATAACQAPGFLAASSQQPPSSSAGATLRGAALRAVQYCPDAAEFGAVLSRFEPLYARLPCGPLQRVERLTAQVEAAVSGAAHADAALQAALQAVVERRRAADLARETAASAADAFRACMAELLSQHQHQPQQQQLGCPTPPAPPAGADACDLEALQQQELCLWDPPAPGHDDPCTHAPMQQCGHAPMQELCLWGPPQALERDELDEVPLQLVDPDLMFFGAGDCGAEELLGLDCGLGIGTVELMVEN